MMRDTTLVHELVADRTDRTVPTLPIAIEPPIITWEKLPDDFILPDDPVDNTIQSQLAEALNDLAHRAGLVTDTSFTCTNYGIIATVNGKTIAKAPDWAYIPHLTVSKQEIERSYTPHLEGDVPTIVLEFISATDGGEYSKQLATPMGKWYFYEQVLKVPYYGIFEPKSGDFELYRLNAAGVYQRQLVEESGRYWIPELNLEIAAWKGQRRRRDGYWLRFWNEDGHLIPWAEEVIEATTQAITQTQQQLEETQQELGQTQQELGQTQQELGQTQQELGQTQQELDQTQQELSLAQRELEAEKARADRLTQKLRELGLES